MRNRRPVGKLRYVAFDSQFEESPCIPEKKITLDGINCRLLKYYVAWEPEGKRRTIAIYEETTALDAKVNDAEEQELQLWNEWEDSKSEETLCKILDCIEKQHELLGVRIDYRTQGREDSPKPSA